MKKTTVLLILCVLFTACNTNQQKAEKLVKKYLNENLVDIDSYQNIEMGDVQKISWVDLYVIEQVKELKTMKKEGIPIDNALNQQAENIENLRENLAKNNINPDSIIAYSLEHKYRAKNSLGGYVINHVKYTFDNKLETIIGIENMD